MVLLLVAIDVACLIVALLTAHAVRFGFLPDVDYMTGVLAAVFVWPIPFYALGLYGRQHLSRPTEFRRTTAAVAMGIGLLIAVSFFSDMYLSRSWIAIAFGLAVILELTTRMIVWRITAPRARNANGLTISR